MILIQYWPQFAYLALLTVGLGMTLQQHGKPKTGNESIWISLTASSIALFLLYMGGFFK